MDREEVRTITAQHHDRLVNATERRVIRGGYGVETVWTCDECGGQLYFWRYNPDAPVKVWPPPPPPPPKQLALF